MDRGFAFAAGVERARHFGCRRSARQWRDVGLFSAPPTREPAALHPLGGAFGQAGRQRVDLEQDYFGFRDASKQVGVGYDLAAPTRRNLKELASGTNLVRNSGKGRKKKA